MIPQTPVRDWEAQVYDFLDAPVPDEARAAGERIVADVLAAAVAGSEAPDVRETSDGGFGGGPALVLGTNRRRNASQAALLNAAAAIAQEIEEGHNEGGHVGAALVTGALALAETHDSTVSGADFVDACVKAYEVSARLERAIFAMKARLNESVPWLIRDPHATWTVVGPALAGLLAVDAADDVLVDAFRAAANTAVVSMFDPYAEGAPARNFTAGHSAATGVNVALAAAAGVTGSAEALERVYDPLDEMLDGGFAESMVSLGERWYVTEVYVKTTPSCRYTHPPLDALRELDARPDADRVERVDVYTYGNAVDMARADPDTFTGGKFSIPYVLARELVSRDVTLDDFTPERLADPAVRDLAGRVSLHADADFEAAFPESWGARVELTLTDGATRTGERAYPYGDYRDPSPRPSSARSSPASSTTGSPTPTTTSSTQS
ncbi:MmgE/PrpD family protein [Halocalculus aciditolerans]|uniref:MmgE/PrpD family protein n=1 Tax=Halocalculus aciditolerans TaxID=1383812 RepID=A0A830FEN8_9EURY|nr:MmgE/PrpD family protein [Halocalculus aciditolerans]GGL67622.1 hypothetical protein GCM10009039_27010 [Halocalculus aciditolerans]